MSTEPVETFNLQVGSLVGEEQARPFGPEEQTEPTVAQSAWVRVELGLRPTAREVPLPPADKVTGGIGKRQKLVLVEFRVGAKQDGYYQALSGVGLQLQFSKDFSGRIQHLFPGPLAVAQAGVEGVLVFDGTGSAVVNDEVVSAVAEVVNLPISGKLEVSTKVRAFARYAAVVWARRVSAIGTGGIKAEWELTRLAGDEPLWGKDHVFAAVLVVPKVFPILSFRVRPFAVVANLSTAYMFSKRLEPEKWQAFRRVEITRV
jgi:hypothetical protein